jgi:hypothetical protein
MRADEAEQALASGGYVVSFQSSEGSVWSSGNWTVDVQEPLAGELTPAGSEVTLTVSRSAPEATPWSGPTDGTWSRGDYGLGAPVRGQKLLAGSLSSDYEIAVTAPPSLTTTDGGTSVTMSSPLFVTRVQDGGFGRSFAESERIFFESESRPETEQYNEAWGTRTSIECDPATVIVGESMNCTVSFTTMPEAVVNSYWQVNGKTVAAWPGQLP